MGQESYSQGSVSGVAGASEEPDDFFISMASFAAVDCQLRTRPRLVFSGSAHDDRVTGRRKRVVKRPDVYFCPAIVV